jgi:glycosyltransferase involved in cell wall biosynthesis
MSQERKVIALFLESLNGGGVQRVVLNLAKSFVDKGFAVDIVLFCAKGPFLENVPSGCSIIDLNVNRAITSIPKIISYLKKRKPDVMITNFLIHTNSVCLIAKLISRAKTKVILVNHTYLSESMKFILSSYKKFSLNYFRTKVSFHLAYLVYPLADSVVAVSKGIADDLEKNFPNLMGKVKVIYNPVFSEEILKKSEEPVSQEWFQKQGMPIIISVGRLETQKGFSTLLRAFAIVQNATKCKLVILGEGRERSNLNYLAEKLSIEKELWMPGFVDNPYKYMSKASLFVLSSIYEGFGNVLVEALALGCPVVSTDCPSGPSEILENGKYGKLVPVGDSEAMAKAILETLKNPPDKEFLISRAQEFSVEKAVEKYLELFTRGD